MLGTEKCGNVRGEIAAELCHQGIGISFATCCNNYHSGKWYKDARESEDNSTIMHANKSNKRWKLTILSENPTDVEKSLIQFTWTSRNPSGSKTLSESTKFQRKTISKMTENLQSSISIVGI